MIRTLARQFALDLAVFAAILLVGLARLPEPFSGDQSLNMLMGQAIAGGGSPYADVWDLKHPGIFFFFAGGGALFGFSEVGVHLFELFWMLALALVVRLMAHQWLQRPWTASLAPAFTVGFYYAATTSYHLTQTEAVIGLPLLSSLGATAAAVHRGTRKPRLWAFVSGISAGIVCVFKAPYVVLPALFWVVAAIEWQRADRRRIGAMGKMAAAALVGLLLPVTMTIVYLALKSGLSLVWWTFVVHPREAASRGGIDPQRFADSLLWFLRTFRVLLVLAIVGAAARLRRGPDLLTRSLVVWTAAGALVIWGQVISWWPYHYVSLVVPVGLLAAAGTETLSLAATAASGPRWRRAAAMSAMAVLSVLSVRQLEPIASVVAAVFGARPLPYGTDTMRAYNAGRYADYADALATTAFLREPGSHAGPIYVFGNPAVYSLAGRRPAIPLPTWGTSPPAGAWNQLVSELDAAAPAYVLVSEDALRFVITMDPSLSGKVSALRSRLERRYQELHTDACGTWYVRSDLARQAAGARIAGR